jgi:murein DD-endopeptidase MepM/ murein hydrolase activator NlpD
VANLKTDMNLGGGTAKKAKLVTDLTDEYRKLNLVLERTEQLSKNIADNLTRAKSTGTGAGNNTVLPNYPGGPENSQANNYGFKQPPGGGGGQPGGGGGPSFGSVARRLGAFAVATAGAAMQAIDSSQYIENDLARRRFGFFAGQPGTQAGSQAFRSMMTQGTATDPMDAARAAMMGTSYGMMPGLANYSTIARSAAMFSNLTPGAGLEGGMSATVALNQASSVNKLRMIGIQVRGDNGLMRSAEDIANDLWNKINREKTGGSPISANDIALSLQPGNALDMLLNQYFGGDPVLRSSIVSVLMQKAGGKGFSKKELAKSGALPEIAQSFGERNKAAYGTIDAYTNAGVEGAMEANRNLIKVSEFFERSVNTFDDAVKQFVKFDIMTGGGNNAIGSMLNNIISNVVGPLLTAFGIKKLFTSGAQAAGIGPAGTAPVTGPKARPGVRLGMKFGVGALAAGFAAQGLDTMFGDDVSSETRERGLAAASVGQYALTGAALGSIIPGVGTGVGALLGTLYGGFKNRGALFGSGGGEDTTLPISGSRNITSPYGIVRKDGKLHKGVDYSVPIGTPIYAVKSGRVLETFYDGDGFGNWVKLRHGDGNDTIYAHLSSKAAAVGSMVNAGDIIGYSGSSGNSTGPHLHFQVQTHDGAHKNPLEYISGARTADQRDYQSGMQNVGTATPTAGSSEQFSGAMLFETSAKGSLLGSTQSGARLFSSRASGGGVDTSSSVGTGNYTTYGGVTVNINLPAGTKVNEKELAREVKRILDNENQIRMAVTR